MLGLLRGERVSLGGLSGSLGETSLSRCLPREQNSVHLVAGMDTDHPSSAGGMGRVRERTVKVYWVSLDSGARRIDFFCP